MQIFDAHYNAGEESIVIAYKNRKQIDLVSFDGEMIKRIYFPNYDYNIPKMHIEENNLKYDVNARLFFHLFIPKMTIFMHYVKMIQETILN